MRKKKSQKYVLNYTCGNVSKRTGETREKVRQWLKRQLKQSPLICPFCQITLTVGSFAVDHKTPIFRGGNAGLENCWLTCPKCNRAKGDLTVGEFELLYSFLSQRGNEYLSRSVLARLKLAGILYKGKR